LKVPLEFKRDTPTNGFTLRTRLDDETLEPDPDPEPEDEPGDDKDTWTF
jgi:hypothetical protein